MRTREKTNDGTAIKIAGKKNNELTIETAYDE
jgi:hypothetical protein